MQRLLSSIFVHFDQLQCNKLTIKLTGVLSKNYLLTLGWSTPAKVDVQDRRDTSAEESHCSIANTICPHDCAQQAVWWLPHYQAWKKGRMIIRHKLSGQKLNLIMFPLFPRCPVSLRSFGWKHWLWGHFKGWSTVFPAPQLSQWPLYQSLQLN